MAPARTLLGSHGPQPCYDIVSTTSPAADASLFVGDDDSDKNATAEIYMLVAGVSTIAFGLRSNLPFIVAPSVLYASRQAGYVKYTELRS